MSILRQVPFKDFELPKIEQIKNNLWGACFSLMKLVPARYIIQNAIKEGKLHGGEIVETTSGSFGIALAMISASMGYKLTLVSDPVIDEKLHLRLSELGAKVDIITRHASGGYQQARLDRVNEIINCNNNVFWPNQYGNPNNANAYHIVAEFLTNKIDSIDFIVGTVGSGGSMIGISNKIREKHKHLKVVGVDTCNSILFGQKDGPRSLRGLGNSIMPKNLDHSIFDGISWVPSDIAFKATRLLHKNHGLYMGGTSGAAYLVANWLSDIYPDAKIVVIFPDDGHRYTDTIYNNDWLKMQVVDFNYTLPTEPKPVNYPQEDQNNWTYLNWSRKKLEV